MAHGHGDSIGGQRRRMVRKSWETDALFMRFFGKAGNALMTSITLSCLLLFMEDKDVGCGFTGK